MRKQAIIRNSIAAFLLVLYTISIAPKAFFHDVLAHHKDAPACAHFHKTSVCLHAEKINCHFDNLVVTALYVFDVKTVVFTDVQHFDAVPAFYTHSFHSCYRAAAGSRGPPAV